MTTIEQDILTAEVDAFREARFCDAMEALCKAHETDQEYQDWVEEMTS